MKLLKLRMVCAETINGSRTRKISLSPKRVFIAESSSALDDKMEELVSTYSLSETNLE